MPVLSLFNQAEWLGRVILVEAYGESCVIGFSRNLEGQSPYEITCQQ
jgi:hypothetical protein